MVYMLTQVPVIVTTTSIFAVNGMCGHLSPALPTHSRARSGYTQSQARDKKDSGIIKVSLDVEERKDYADV